MYKNTAKVVNFNSKKKQNYQENNYEGVGD